MDEQVGRREARVLVALGILALLLVGIGGPLWTAHNEQLATPVIVQGTVFDQSGRTLAEITVQVYRWEHRQWEAINAVDTNDHGFYRFAGLKSGRYTVAFEDDSGTGYLESWWGGGMTAGKAKYRIVAPGTTAILNDRVRIGATITGHASVIDPVQGTIDATQFSIAAYPLTPLPGGGYTIHWTRSVSSLDPVIGGDWRIKYLRTGSYVLQAVDNDEYPALHASLGSRWIGVPESTPYKLNQWTSAKIFTVVQGKAYQSPSVVLTYASADPHPAFVLKVVDAAGHPIAGARVDMILNGGDQSSHESGVDGALYTDARGEFSVYRATPGVYSLTILRTGFAPYTNSFRFRQGQSGESSTTVTLASTSGP